MAAQLNKDERTAQSQLDLEEAALVAAGFAAPPLWRRFRSETVLVMVYLSVAILIVGLNLAPGQPKKLLQGLATVPAAIALTLGYLQWRAARHEGSFDRYYDRLNMANDRFDAWRLEFFKDNPEKLQEHLYIMFTFAELDNLEYVLEKYKLGYVRKELARRAIRTFRSRCENTPNFREGALHWVGREETQQMAKGYEKTTGDVVRYIISNCSRQDSASQRGI